jgi:hypothetical protein
MYHRPLTKSRIISAAAFEHERAYLTQIPPHLPAPYRVHDRGIDQYGYVAFGVNYYWVPGKDRDDVKVIEYGDRLKIYRGRELLAEYTVPPDGTRNACFRPEGQPKPRHEPHRRRDRTLEEEKRLRAIDYATWGAAMGRGSSWDEMLRRAGLVDGVGELSADEWGQVPLSREKLLQLDPDLLVLPGWVYGNPKAASAFFGQITDRKSVV